MSEPMSATPVKASMASVGTSVTVLVGDTIDDDVGRCVRWRRCWSELVYENAIHGIRYSSAEAASAE